MNETELKQRTKQSALRVIRLTAALSQDAVGRTMAGQLVRCGTSVGANYRAACCGRSKADFAAKLAIAEEEADESAYWLELIVEAELLPEPRVQPLHQEALELCRIFAASRITARQAEQASSRTGRLGAAKMANGKS